MPSVRTSRQNSSNRPLPLAEAMTETRQPRRIRRPQPDHALLPPLDPTDHFGLWLQQQQPQWRWDWNYLVHIRQKLALITSGQLKRLALFLPPRHGKSQQTTVRYPVYRMQRNPSLRVCVGCYNQQYANTFGRQSRGIARTRFEISRERHAATEWETTGAGMYRCCGVGSPPTGQGFDLLIIDDPIRKRQDAESQAHRDRCWDWYKDDLYTRLEPDAAIILIMTRWTVDDLAAPSWRARKALTTQ